MWDQWLQAASENNTDASSSIPPVESQSHNAYFQKIHGLMKEVFECIEWWRWVAVAGGMVCLCTGLYLLVKHGQAPTPIVSQTANSEQIIPDVQVVGGTTFPSLPATISATLSEELIYIDVSGAVVHPGVQTVPVTSRAGSAIEAAGGLSKQAHQEFILKYFNAAAVIHDGQKIYIPFAGENLTENLQINSVPAANSTTDGTESLAKGITSINTASSKQLDALPGIGAARAEQIMAGRPYVRIEELIERGILTESIYSEISGLISL